MKQIKVPVILTILVVVLATMAVSGCTTGSVTVSPTAAPTAAPTSTPTATTMQMPMGTPTPVPSDIPPATATVPGYTLPPYVDFHVSVNPDQPGITVLTIKGNVSHPLYLSMSDLRAIGVKHVNLTLNSHGKISYIDADAVSLNALLNNAGPLSGATSATFHSDVDGYNAVVTLANISADQNSVLALTSDQGLRDCIPSQAAKYWVQNLTVITVS